MQDRDIVAAVVAGDPAGLAAAYDRYAAALHVYCRSLLAEPADAADAVQDTFVIAAAKLADLRDPDRLRPWLYAVARNECHRRLRSQARLAPLETAGEVTDAAAGHPSGPGRRELADLVAAALAGLNPSDREVIELNLRHDLGGSDLADALGVPLNHAHALASRARGQLERSLGALLVARTGRGACPELAAILAGWDGQLTTLMRKRFGRHIDGCTTCGERKRRVLSPAMLLGALPLLPLPPGLRQQVLRLVSDNGPEAVRYKAMAVSRAGPFGPAGFPHPVQPAGSGGGRWTGRPGPRHAVASVAVAAAIVIAAGVGTAAVLRSHSAEAASRGRVAATVPVSATPTVTAPVSSKPGPATAKATSPAAPSATPTTPPPAIVAPSTPVPSVAPSQSASPSPSVMASHTPGTLVLSSQSITLPDVAPYAATFTMTAQGGPVAYAISVPAAESYLSLAPATGSLKAGQKVTITVTVTPPATGAPPAYSNTATVTPGGIAIIIYFPPSG